MTTAHLVENLTAALERSSLPIAAAYLFGSQVSGDTWAESDVDVAVLLDEPDPIRRAEMGMSLSEEVQRALSGRTVDVVCLDGDSDGFAYEVLRTGRCLVCRDASQRARFEAATYQRHFDLAPLNAICRHYLLRRVREGRMLERSLAMVDRQRVEQLIAYIQEMLNRLRVQQGKSFDEFANDFLSVDAALRELQTTLEAVSDIATHVIAGANLGTPTDRPHAIELLAQHQVLPRELADRIVQAVRMRNILVHFYPHVNLRKVYDAIQHDLPDIGAFCAEIVKYLDENAPANA
ncbi:MAG: DUF86 domain-containing protein [Abditibacteriales bacterium]|nr:DUF86 domain-containing protein [Abditibacteriales bacterium]MDW8365298.1 DUF86 domain-containing protein [Abditibacteriales bacterium]